MKLTARDIPGFLQKPQQVRGCLIYGPDEGQVRDTAKRMIPTLLGEGYDPLNLVELTDAQLKDDPARLIDELNSFSLMGGERLVWLRDPGNGLAPLVKEAVVEGNPGAYLLITGGDLKPTSKLRQLCEKEKLLAALPCYKDDARQLSGLIQQAFRDRQIVADRDAMSYLASALGNDRGVTLQEIEKIDLFLSDDADGSGSRRLSLEQAMVLTGDNSELTLDDVCHAVAGGQPMQLQPLLNRLYADGTQPIGVFRILHSHFQKLQHMQAALRDGASLDMLFKQMRIFFKQQPLLRRQLQCWNMQSLIRAMDALMEAERMIKTSAIQPETYCSQLLQRLSLNAARAGGR